VTARRKQLRAFAAALAIQWRACPLASAVALGITATTSAAAASQAWMLKRLLDELGRGSAGHSSALGFGIAAAAISGVTVVLLQLAEYLQVVIRRRTMLAVDRGLFGKAATFRGLQPFEDPQFQSRLRAAERAAGTMPHEITQLMETLVRTVVTVATLIGVVVVVSPTLALVLVASAAVGFAAQMLRSRADVGSIDRMVHHDRWRDAYRALLLDVKAAKEIRLFGLGRLFLDRLTAATERSTAEELAAERRAAILQAGLAGLSAGTAAFGVAIAIAAVGRGQLAPGDVVLLLAAIAGISNVFAGLLITLGTVGRTLTMFHRYLEVMKIPSEPPGPFAPLPPLRRGIELRDVWFRYDAASPWILRGVDLVIPAGASIALVGLNGAGKSTLVKLLCRFYDVERGQILWDGVDITSIDPRALRRRIGATFQDFMTYDLTAEENIGLGDVERLDDLDRVRDAARQVDIDAALAALPHGYATLLSRALPETEQSDSPGVALSGGQWQRVAIARSIVRSDVDLLILDEPSSGLDAVAELRVHRALAGHAFGRTRLLISHRLSALRTADLIAVLSDGQIIERGSHDALMVKGGSYAELFALQASGYQDERVASHAVGVAS
jgi:ATP-binding cassette, subfamily B, bacterial